MICLLLYFSLSAQDDASATGFEGILYAGITIYGSSSREIRSFYVFHQFFNGDFAPRIYISHRRVQDFAHIVRRHIGSHADSNTGSSVYEKIRNASRQNCRLSQRVVKVKLEIYRIFIDITQHFFGEPAQPGFSITHGCRTIIIH